MNHLLDSALETEHLTGTGEKKLLEGALVQIQQHTTVGPSIPEHLCVVATPECEAE